MKDILFAENLKGLRSVRHGLYTKAWGDGGMSSAPDGSAVIQNRRQIAESLHISAEMLLSCRQIHSTKVETVLKIWPAHERPEADAMVTREKGIGLAILTADCVPILFADDEAGVIGAAHAGWKGALGGIIENTIEAMKHIGAKTERLHAALGPCIWQNSYEVGPEYPAPFLAEDPKNQAFFRISPREGHYSFDLPGYVIAKLRKAGILSIEPSPADTCLNEDRFFSYRRSTLRHEIRAGNLISAIVLSK